jgi:catechol 2,3-dioxygenase-like lactoylglutathione lyase family enzyme
VHAASRAPLNNALGVIAEAATLQLVVNIDADDLEKAVEFYTAAVGLRPGRRLFEGSVAEMLGGYIHDPSALEAGWERRGSQCGAISWVRTALDTGALGF